MYQLTKAELEHFGEHIAKSTLRTLANQTYEDPQQRIERFLQSKDWFSISEIHDAGLFGNKTKETVRSYLRNFLHKIDGPSKITATDLRNVLTIRGFLKFTL